MCYSLFIYMCGGQTEMRIWCSLVISPKKMFTSVSLMVFFTGMENRHQNVSSVFVSYLALDYFPHPLYPQLQHLSCNVIQMVVLSYTLLNYSYLYPLMFFQYSLKGVLITWQNGGLIIPSNYARKQLYLKHWGHMFPDVV